MGDDQCTNGKDIMTADDRLQELIGLAHAAAQPQLTEPALRERFGRPDGWPLRAGAVWRARWDDVALLVLLVGNPTAMTVAVTPVTFDDTGAGAERFSWLSLVAVARHWQCGERCAVTCRWRFSTGRSVSCLSL